MSPGQLSAILAATTDVADVALIAALVAAIGGVTVAALAHRRAQRASLVLERARRHDVLTDLANRSVARACVDQLLDEGSVGLLLVELDRFADVNESYGHEVGDRLLRSMAEQLEGLVAQDEVLARWGGPIFALVVPGLTTSDQVAGRGRAVQDALQAKVRIGHDTLRVTASFGGVVADRQRFASAGEVVDAAVTALELARTDGRGGHRTFDRTMTMPVTTATAADRIRRAMADGELWVMWQPVASLTDRTIAGVEAVTFWADPSRGVLPPDEFEDLVRRAGLEAEVAEHALDEALAQAGRWHVAHPDLVVMVSTPPALLRRDGIAAELAGKLAGSGAVPSSVCVQLSGQARSDIYDLWGVMRQIKDLDLQVALDDFGTGWSSLSYLRRFSIDVLKLPPAFVAAMTVSRTDEAVLQQLIGLARALEMVPVAEGIEQRAQAELLVSLGCDLGQGPLYGPPMTLDSFEVSLAKGKLEPGAKRGGSGIDWTATTS